MSPEPQAQQAEPVPQPAVQPLTLSRPPSDDEDDELTSVWIVTYSDMVTLLLSFFLLIYAFSVFGEQKQGELVRELNRMAASQRPPAAARQREDLERTAREIARTFGAGKEKAWVDASEAEVTVGLPSSITFALGEATLTPVAEKHLTSVAVILAKLPNVVRVEGHTDDLPIRGGRLGSNWHLSAARAQSVVRLFIAQGLDPRRLQVLGYGETRPRRPNTSDENRQANRRIEIKLVRASLPAPPKK